MSGKTKTAKNVQLEGNRKENYLKKQIRSLCPGFDGEILIDLHKPVTRIISTNKEGAAQIKEASEKLGITIGKVATIITELYTGCRFQDDLKGAKLQIDF